MCCCCNFGNLNVIKNNLQKKLQMMCERWKCERNWKGKCSKHEYLCNLWQLLEQRNKQQTTIKLQQSEQNDNDMCCGNKKPCFTLAFSIKLQNQFSPQISIFTFVSICIFLMLQGEAKARGACLELHRSTGANR